ncbi:MAG: hypothetical protein ACJ71Z_13760 [Aeromicrobium sp.]
MGMRLAWMAFGAAVFYLVAAIAVPTIIVVLRNRGVEIDDDAAMNLTRLVAVIATPLGGALGMRHARKVEEADPRI